MLKWLIKEFIETNSWTCIFLVSNKTIGIALASLDLSLIVWGLHTK